MLPILNLGGLALPVKPLLLLAGFWFGLTLAEKQAKRYQLKPDEIYNLAFFAMIAWALGGRLAFVAINPDSFIDNPLNIFSRNFSLFDPAGGAAIALITAFAYGQRKKLPLWPTLDALTPFFGMIAIAIPLGNFASGDAFGAPTNLPWAIDIWGATRHPVQLFEMAAAAGILWLLRPAARPKSISSGTLFLYFIVLSATSRLFFEGLRGNSFVTFLNLRSYQLVAWFLIAGALWLINKRKNVEINNK